MHTLGKRHYPFICVIFFFSLQPSLPLTMILNLTRLLLQICSLDSLKIPTEQSLVRVLLLTVKNEIFSAVQFYSQISTVTFPWRAKSWSDLSSRRLMSTTLPANLRYWSVDNSERVLRPVGKLSWLRVLLLFTYFVINSSGLTWELK